MISAASRHPCLHHVQRGVVLLLCLALGLQWALLQGIAWTEMLISFASEGSVIEAVEKTFDGQHACELCKKVKEGTQDSNKRKQSTLEESAGKGMHAVLASPVVLIPPTAKPLSFAPLCAVLVRRNEIPEPPPPRCGQV